MAKLVAGRPRAPKSIVDDSELLSIGEISAEKWRFETLLPELETDDNILRWMVRRRLLRNTVNCVNCGGPCSLISFKSGADGRKWHCCSSKCSFTRSVRDGSFFARSHLSLKQILILMYCWCLKERPSTIAHEANVNVNNTVAEWCKYFKDECETWLKKNPDPRKQNRRFFRNFGNFLMCLAENYAGPP